MPQEEARERSKASAEPGRKAPEREVATQAGPGFAEEAPSGPDVGSSTECGGSSTAGGANEDAFTAEANAVLDQARRLMEEDNSVVEAAALLAESLDRLEASGAGEQAAAAARAIRNAPAFETIIERMQQLENIGKLLDPTNFKQLWAKDDAILWVNTPPEAKYFEYRVTATLDGSLSEFMAMCTEVDLLQKHNPLLIGPPSILGASSWHRVVIRSLIGFLMLKIEMIFEVVRFIDTKVGFLAERLSPDFPTEGVPIPPKSWQTIRVYPHTLNLLLPRGGGQSGLIWVTATRVEVGVPIPTFVKNFFCNIVAMEALNSLRNNLKLVRDPRHPWLGRLAEDQDGFYARLKQVEEVASKRETLSLLTLPGREIFQVPRKLAKTRFDASQVKAGSASAGPSTAACPEGSCREKEVRVEL